MENKRNKTFKPKAKNCARCSQYTELKPKNPQGKQCIQFNWLIHKTTAQRQACCSSTGPELFIGENPLNSISGIPQELEEDV